MNKKLFFFTDSYPYGIGETWKTNELKCLVNYFDDITVVPYHYSGNFDNPVKEIEGIKYEKPLFRNLSYRVNWSFLSEPINRNIFFYLGEFISKKVFLNKKRLILWISATAFTHRLLKHPTIKQILNCSDKNTTFYFYWGTGSCRIVPFIDKHACSKIVVRLHGYDLFEEDYDDYIPYRKSLLGNITMAASVSKRGADYMKIKYPDIKFNIGVFRLGVIKEGESKMSSDNVLRIITCSMLIPLKRIPIIIKSLGKLSIPVEWTHLGDGPLIEEFKMQSDKLPSNIKINFEGWIPNNLVLTYYIDHQTDLFLNVSETEGVPVSVMEALSAGIPVFATNVGGTGEIIDNTVGKLLPADISPEKLAEEIKGFYNLSKEEKLQYRQNAKKRFNEMCRADVLANEMGKMLSQ